MGKISSKKSQNTQSIDKEIYFIISNSSEEKINFSDLKCISEIHPKIIYEKSVDKGKVSFLFHHVFKLVLKKSENHKYKVQYEIGEILYDIFFEVKNNMFIYEIKLQEYNKLLNNIPIKDIDQNQITIQNKLDIFLEALEKNNEINKIEILYKETIDLYKTKKNFSLLIFLFLKLYQRKKELCSLLTDIFKEINAKENTDRDENLAKELETFNQIYSNANNLIKKNKYDPVGFYGIIFCYLSSYDQENFSKIINNFLGGNTHILYEILITYYSHFNIKLNQNSEFFNNLVKYAINKLNNFEIFLSILNYIDDIETFLYVINENKKEIFKEYDELKNKPIKLSPNLKLIKKEYEEGHHLRQKTELDNIISIIEKLIEFSKNNSILLIYLNCSFWTYFLKQYNKIDLANIDNCYRLRNLFKKYKDLINVLYNNSSHKNELNIKDEINRYNDRDEFALDLNEKIKKMLEIEKDKFNDSEKLGIIRKYNPYYNSEIEEDKIKYKYMRETDIFNDINFKNLSGAFKLTFHHLNFEEIFKENIIEFINKITSKIIDISTFGNVIEIIDITRLDEDKKIYYYNILKDKYALIIKNEIESLKEEDELYKAIKILCNFICFIFDGENNTKFLEEKIIRLNDKLQKLIYFELIKDKKNEKIKNYIFDLYSKKLKEPDKIIELIKILNDEDKNQFLEKLMKVGEFEKNEFYSNYENDKIKLICKLNEQEIINRNNCGELINIIDDIMADLENNLLTKK